MSESSDRRGETSLIEHYFAPLADDTAAFGLSDDTAFLDIPNDRQLVLTKDMLIADVHFFADDNPAMIARKALRVNLSDLAAKGAKPLGYLLGLGLPSNWTEAWLSEFCQGLKQDQQAFSFPLLGGDTVKNPERLTLSITAFGTIKKGKQVLRKNARAGENIYVTGTIGDGALGLDVRKGEGQLLGLDAEHRSHLLDRFLLPQPRLDCTPLIMAYASASMDISDGLLGDAKKMASAAHIGIEIDQPLIPLSPAARSVVEQDAALWPKIVSGGDDYELMFTAPTESHSALLASALEIQTPITHIGRVSSGEGVYLLGTDGKILSTEDMLAYEHF